MFFKFCLKCKEKVNAYIWLLFTLLYLTANTFSAVAVCVVSWQLYVIQTEGWAHHGVGVSWSLPRTLVAVSWSLPRTLVGVSGGGDDGAGEAHLLPGQLVSSSMSS